MLADRVVGQRIKTSCGDIGLELPIPSFRVKRQEPLAEPSKLIGGKGRDSLFKFFECHTEFPVSDSKKNKLSSED